MSHPVTPPVLWRAAGAFALTHVLVLIGATALTGPPTVHDGQAGIEHSFNDGDLARLMTAGYLTVIGFLVVVPTMVFLAQHLGRRTAVGRWSARTGAAAGVAYVVVIVGAGFSAGAAALWGRDHGLALETVLAVNNIRNFSYLLALPLAGAFAIGTGVAALQDNLLTRWVGWGGVGVGAALVLAIPAAAAGIQYGMPLWLLWWVGVAVSLMRHRGGATMADDRLDALAGAR